MERTTFQFVLLAAFCPLGCVPTANGGRVGKAALDLITVAAEQGRLPEPANRGREILLRSDEAYSQLVTYTGTTTVMARQDTAAGEVPQRLRCRVAYSRPDKILIDGHCHATSLFEHSFSLGCDGKTAWESSSVVKHGACVGTQNVRDAMLKYQGVSSHGTIILPSLLLGIEWERENGFLPKGRLLPAFASSAVLDEEEFIDGKHCYRVVCDRTIGTWTFWVDADCHLLRQLTEDFSAEQLAAQKKYGGGGFGCTLSGRITQTFAIDDVNGPIEDSIFRLPSEKPSAAYR